MPGRYEPGSEGETRRDYLKLASTGAVGITTAGIAGCLSDESDTLHIGGSQPLTGPLADAGEWIRRAWEIWAEEINEEGGLLGQEVELTVYDHENESSEIRSTTTRLIEDDDVDVLLGTYPTAAVPVANGVIDRHEIPVIHIFEPVSIIEEREKNSDHYPTSFGLVNANATFPRTFVEFLAELPADERPNRIACVSRNDLLGEEMSRFAREAADEHGFEVVADEYYDPESDDLSPVVRSIQSDDPEIIMGGSYPGDSILLARGIGDVDIDIEAVHLAIGSQVPSTVDSLGEIAEYMFGTSPWVHSFPDDATQELVEKSQERWGAVPPYQLGVGMAQVEAYEQALREIESTNPDDLLEKFRTSSFDTIGGTFEFDNRNVSTMPHAITQVFDGSIEVVWPDDVQTAEPVIRMPDDAPIR